MTGRNRDAAQLDGHAAHGAPATPGTHQQLAGFLAANRVEVLDVTRGAAAGTRRLLLGEPGARFASHVVAVADHPSSASAIEAEIRVLEALRAGTAPTVVTTLPRIITPAIVGDRPAVVMTAVPGMRPGRRRRRPQPMARADLTAVSSWLGTLWSGTGGPADSVDLGRYGADLLFARYCGSSRLAPTLGAVHRARHRLEPLHVARTAVHGCLCPRHAYVREGVVGGVDDWGLASPSGEPLRDLGGFAVRYAGSRLPEVVAGRTMHAHLLRDFVMAGLRAAGLPSRRWRDVLLLAQVEKAAKALERGQVDEIRLLAATAVALPQDQRRQEAAQI
ncbi:MAG: hypothetical protein GEU93_18650 [Propionibacteriales bacterium]|nr:hypothetical protein [Propionibacteriales bacterium]